MASEIWAVDTTCSRLTFALRHLIVAEITGQIRNWQANLRIDSVGSGHASVEATLDARSTDTGNAERDEHIRSAEFLNVAAFPEIRFRSREVKHTHGNHYLVAGDLTIRDVTREVTLEVEDLGRRQDGGGRRASFHAHATVNRQHFGLHWNQDLDTGGVVLGDKVDINIDIEAVTPEGLG